MDLIEKLDATIDVIQAGGWVRDDYGGASKLFPHCLLGAWDAATEFRGEFFPVRCFKQALGTTNIVHWNDFEAEDRHEVVATLLRMRNDVLRGKCK